MVLIGTGSTLLLPALAAQSITTLCLLFDRKRTEKNGFAFSVIDRAEKVMETGKILIKVVVNTAKEYGSRQYSEE
jgi:hypothetical protein